MAQIDFPANPTTGQQYTSGGVTWTWDGYKWTTSGSTVAYLPIAGGTMSGPIVLAADPASALQATTKQYADTKFPTTGGTITGNLSVNGGTIQAGNGAGYATLNLVKVGGAAGANQIVGFSGGTATANLRWNMQFGNATAESGSNAGSDFGLSRYTDAGAFIDTPLSITRSTGQLTTGSATSDGVLNINGNTQPRVYISNASGTYKGQFYWQASSGQFGIATPSGSAFVNGSGQFQSAVFYNSTANAYMAGGTLWTNSSDARIKTVHGDYNIGLDHLLKLKPVRFSYKANDTIDERLDEEPLHTGEEVKPYEPRAFESAPYPASQHYAIRDRELVGLIAQDVEEVFPGLVAKREGFIDGKKVDDLRDLNLNDMLFAMVNAIKTLSARLEAAETTLATIKAL